MNNEQDIFLPNNLRSLTFGVGWTAREGTADLDASLVFYRFEQKLDHTFFRHRKTLDRACTHSGDNRVGGDGILDDEQIVVDLTKVHPKVNTIMFVVNVFDEGKNFTCLKRGFARLRNDLTGKEIYRIALKKLDVSGVIFCKAYRYAPTQWRVHPVYFQTDSHTFDKTANSDTVMPYLYPSSPERKFRVTVHEARDLPLPDGDAINPFFDVRFDRSSEKSHSQKGTTSPQYDTAVTVYGQGTVIEINFWSKRRSLLSRRDLFIGRINLLVPVQNEPIMMQPTWFPLLLDGATTAHSGEVQASLAQL
eukprot:TRINITY_DN9880_c0_g1_i1.p1 TRINITY_DN9880_c0_g1~~TRINITY_DN9880_c0_g1_i1.p1  ORF type:complete len:306 (+),score=41.99 TRINITY_DN9880_c0_g1_i1:38-955(+)